MAITDGLVSYYKLDGDATDVLGTNNGTATNVTWTAGKINNGGSFNGTSSRIKITENNILGTSYTINLIIKPNSVSSGRVIASATDKLTSLGYTDINFQCLLTGSKLQRLATKASPNTDYSATTNANISTTTFTYVSLVYNDSDKTGKIYLNGNLDVSVSRPNGINALNLPIFLGDINSYSHDYFNGQLDEIGIWNRALTQNEITQLYNGGSGIAYPLYNYGIANEPTRTRYRNELGQIDAVDTAFPSGGLVSYYKLDSNANDSFGANNLTNNGTTPYTVCKIGNGIQTSSGKYLSHPTFTDSGFPEWTVSARINTTNNYSGARGFIIDKTATGYEYPMELAVDTDNKIILISRNSTASGTQNIWKSVSVVNDGIWHLIVAQGTHAGGRASLAVFIDGQKNGSLTAGTIDSGGWIASSTADFTIGARGGPGTPFIGLIDEVGIRDRALTQDEITVLYNLGNGRTLA